MGIGNTTPKSALDVSGGMSVGTYAGANAAPSNGLIVSGNVGIGTTSPTNLFYINQTSATTAGTYNTYGLGIGQQGSLVLSQGVDASTGAYMQSWNSKPLILNPLGNNVGIGTTSPGATLDVEGSSQWPLRLRNTGSPAGNYWSIGPDSSNNLVVYNQTPNGVYITTGGTSWSANSDRRVKKNFLPISNALEKTLQLRGLMYHYKTDADTDPRRVGVIAQDVQRVLPEAVTEHDGILGVKYTDLIPLLIEAVKELKNVIDLKFESVRKLITNNDAEIFELKARADKAEAESAQAKARLDSLIRIWCEREPNVEICQ